MRRLSRSRSGTFTGFTTTADRGPVTATVCPNRIRAACRVTVNSRTAGYGRPVTGTSVTWWGHSTLWLADSGVTLLTDPLLTDRLIHLRRRAGATPQLPGAPDAVLLSH